MRRWIATLAAIVVVSVGLLTSTSSESGAYVVQQDREERAVSPAETALESCVRENRHLAVVFLIDQSGSLSKGKLATDPDDKRVDGLRVALSSLLRVGDEPGVEAPEVEVSFIAFAGRSEEVQDWGPLTDESLGSLEEVAESFADRDREDFTNYEAAFLAAKEKLSERIVERADEGLGSCAELFVFTDGRYNVADGAEQKAGLSRLCDPSGIVDQLRRLKVVTYILSLSLGDDEPAREVLDGIAGTPSGEPCGEDGTDRTGQHLPVERAEDLIFPPPNVPQVGRYRRFEGALGLASFDVVAALRPGDDALVLTAPGGDIALARGENQTVTLAGTEVTARWPSDDAVLLTGTFGEGDEWLGPWEVDLRSDDARSTLELELDVDVELLGPEKIQIGETTEVEARLTDRRGAPLVAPVLDQLDVEASIVPGRSDAVPVPLVRNGEDRWSGVAAIPPNVAASVSTIVVRATLPGVEGVRIDPVVREFDLPTRLPPDYIDVEPREFKAPGLKGERGEATSVELPIEIIGSPIADGCVWLPSADVEGPRSVDVSASSRTIGRTEEDCLEVPRGSRRTATVVVRVSSVEDGAASGVLVFRTSSTTKSEELDIEVEVSLPMSRERDVGRLIMALTFLALVGVLVPMLILHAINVVSAGLTHAERLRSYRATVVVDDREVRDLAGGRVAVSATGYLDQFTRVRSGTPPKVRQRELSHGGVTIRSYASGSWSLRSFSLFRGPFAVVNDPGGKRVIARWVGMRRAPRTWEGQTKSEAPNALPGLWVFVPDPVDARPGKVQRKNSVQGQLTVFTLDGDGRATATEAIADLQRQLPDLTVAERGATARPGGSSGSGRDPGRLARLRDAVSARLPRRGQEPPPAPRPTPPKSSY